MDRKIRLAVFGTGQFFENRKKSFDVNSIEIVAFFDNNKKKWGSLLDGVGIIPPDKHDTIEYEYIVIATLDIKMVMEQLQVLGVPKDKVLTYSDYMVGFNCGYREFRVKNSNKEKVLIVYPLLIKGGAMEASLNMARVISEMGFDVTIATERTTDAIKDNLLSRDISIIETTRIYNYRKSEGDWTSVYRVIIASSIDMLQFSMEVCEDTHTILWLHDPATRIRQITDSIYLINRTKCIDTLKVYAVSEIAMRGFNRVFPKKEVKILPYGLQDVKKESFNTKKLIFALIGAPYYIKGYDIFLDAVSRIPDEKKTNVEFWIVGVDKNTKQLPEFQEKVNGLKGLVCIDWMKKSELDLLYAQINVVVSASREDMLPTVLVEGAMNEKVCITSDSTGIAPYIKDGINGFVFKSGNCGELKEKILWCINNRNKLQAIGYKTREIYEKHFSWQVFKDNVSAMMVNGKFKLETSYEKSRINF